MSGGAGGTLTRACGPSRSPRPATCGPTRPTRSRSTVRLRASREPAISHSALDLEPALAQQPNPLAVRKLELDALVLVRTTRADAARTAAGASCSPTFPVVGSAEDRQRRVPQEDELATRPQQPGRLGNPLVRIAPDRGAVLREREVERRVRKRHAPPRSPRSAPARTPGSSLIRRAVSSCAGVMSTPVTRAPRFASQAPKYAVPQPSSITSFPETSPSTPSSELGRPEHPPGRSPRPPRPRARARPCTPRSTSSRPRGSFAT